MMTDTQRGADFHDQLIALLPAAAHEDDPDHDRAVGAAMRVALDDGDPRRATHDYNIWANAHGYQMIVFLGTYQGCVRTDIHEAVIDVDRAGHVSIVEARI